MKKFLTILLLAAFLAGCSSNLKQATLEQPTLMPADTSVPIDTLEPSSIPEPSSTPGPTDTPAPTYTPVPSITPTATITNTPEPDPIVFKGKGPQVVDFKKWNGPAVLKVSNIGGSTFRIRSYNSDGYMVDDLVNVIGSYVGTVPLDFLDYQMSTRLEINSGGTWEISILPLSMIRKISIPGTISGMYDDVFMIVGGAPDLMKADYKGQSYFIVHGFDKIGFQNLVSEYGAWSGTVSINSSTSIIEVRSLGEWQFDFTNK